MQETYARVGSLARARTRVQIVTGCLCIVREKVDTMTGEEEKGGEEEEEEGEEEEEEVGEEEKEEVGHNNSRRRKQ